MTRRHFVPCPGIGAYKSEETTSMMKHRQRRGRRPRQWRARGRITWPKLAALGLISSWVSVGHALDLTYCSTLNTAPDSTQSESIYQSNGLCYDNCKESYAFAVLQGSSCWCSNYAPGSSTSTGDCDSNCPGYPSDKCGNTKKGLYAYIALELQPSGTSGGTTKTTVSTSASSSFDPPISTVTKDKPGPTTTVVSTPSTSGTSRSLTPTSTDTSSTPTDLTTSPPSPASPSVTIVTAVNGYTKTIILSATNNAEAAKSTSSPVQEKAQSGGSFFDHTGKVAGLFVGIALLVVAVMGGLLFFCYRRHLRKAAMYSNGTESPSSGVIPAGGAGVMGGRRRSRSLSTLGLVASEKGIPSTGLSPTSTSNLQGMTAAGQSPETTPRTEIVDQRLDPSEVFLRFDHQTGSSRMSVRSLNDNQDYSRKLKIANPDHLDPANDF